MKLSNQQVDSLVEKAYNKRISLINKEKETLLIPTKTKIKLFWPSVNFILPLLQFTAAVVAAVDVSVLVSVLVSEDSTSSSFIIM